MRISNSKKDTRAIYSTTTTLTEIPLFQVHTFNSPINSRYLKRCSKSAFADLVELHWVTMSLFIIVQLIIWLPLSSASLSIGYSLLLIGLLTFGGTLTLLLKTRRILRELESLQVENFEVTFQDVEKQAVIRKLWEFSQTKVENFQVEKVDSPILQVRVPHTKRKVRLVESQTVDDDRDTALTVGSKVKKFPGIF
jgi:hypothetical protein